MKERQPLSIIMAMNSDMGDTGLELEDLVDEGLLRFLKCDGGEGDEHLNNNMSETSKWADEAMKMMAKGELHKALSFLDLCLPENQMTSKHNGRVIPELIQHYRISESEETNLLEKRCLVCMKLKLYDKVFDDARRLLEKKHGHPLAFKCLIAAHCKKNQLELVKNMLVVWKQCSPNDLEMLECRTKIESLLKAVTNGIDPLSAFSNVEELLGLSYDWLIGRKLPDSQWKYRPVPGGSNSFVLCLQFRFGHCSLGEKCPDAHGELELEEWKYRFSLTNVKSRLENLKLESGASYIKSIMDELSKLEDESKLLADSIPGIRIECAQALTTQIQSCKMEAYTWEFTIETKRPLVYVCLLYEFHRPYFRIGSSFFNGASNKVNLKSGQPSEYSLQVLEVNVSPTAIALTGSKTNVFAYSIDVVFTPEVFGTFRQTVVFDFKGRPKIAKEIIVEVVPPTDDENQSDGKIFNEQPSDKSDSSSANTFGRKSKSTWNFGNADIVCSVTGDRVSSDMLGFALMTSPTMTKIENQPEKELEYKLTKENYKERMRFFLTQEERSRQVILSKYNVSAHLTLFDKYAMKGGQKEGITRYAVDGSLFARMVLFRDISEDTAVGRLILRCCNAVLITQTEEVRVCEEARRKPRVYLCPIADKTKNAIFFDVGQTCVNELQLHNAQVSSFDIQFQLDRTSFMEQKKVVDQITESHLEMLFPDFGTQFHIPWSPSMQWNSSVETQLFRLNPKQKEALIAITSRTNRTPPILIIGPFGTGKTFTLFQCIKYILAETNTRIMICTHSNSAADLYIKEYLDPMVKAGNENVRPLRIYYHLRNLSTVHQSVYDYCLIENGRFRDPTRDEILRHRVIVVTLSTSYSLIDLGLPSDAFSHILLDEAAQAMESEAITPLIVAGENTKLVLAGDHLQLSPELFSEDSKHFHASLLERLHCHYPDNHPCKLMLCENYRSHSAIIQFASDSFYQKRLECGMVQPVHATFYPLTFFAARGEDVQEADSTSYFNMAEVFEISDKVSQLISSWPEKWGNWRDDNAIGVLTPYPDQVTRIRQRLRKKGLYNVAVERVLNVQGKQFRAVFLSTVRTYKPWVRILPDSVGNEVDMGFFSNPKLLNTALTRAQSLVAVVGDPVSLCSLGKCRRLWEDYIHICHENKSLYGMTYTQIKQNILGVEMRLTWGLNPLASEFEPQTFNPMKEPNEYASTTKTEFADPSRMESRVEELPVVTPVSLPLMPQPPSLPTTNPNLNGQFKNQFHPMPLGCNLPSWRGNPPANPYFYTTPQSHPSMVSNPYFGAGPKPGVHMTPTPIVIRPPGYPFVQPQMGNLDSASLGPRFPVPGIPFHRPASSAFAQYRPAHQQQTQVSVVHPNAGFPPLGSAQVSHGISEPLPQNARGARPQVSGSSNNNPWNQQRTFSGGQEFGLPQAVTSEQFATGSPLFRFPTDDIWGRPPQFQPPPSSIQHPPLWPNQGPRMPYAFNYTHPASQHQQPHQVYQQSGSQQHQLQQQQQHQPFQQLNPQQPNLQQQHQSYQQSTLQSSLGVQTPAGGSAGPLQTGGGTQNFSQDEIMYLKRVVEEYTNSAQNQGLPNTGKQPSDETIQAIQSKLSMAVSGMRESRPSQPSLTMGYPGLAYNNTPTSPRTNIPVIPSNTMNPRAAAQSQDLVYLQSQSAPAPEMNLNPASTVQHQNQAYLNLLRETEAKVAYSQTRNAQVQVVPDNPAFWFNETDENSGAVANDERSQFVGLNGQGSQEHVPANASHPLYSSYSTNPNGGVGTNTSQDSSLEFGWTRLCQEPSQAQPPSASTNNLTQQNPYFHQSCEFQSTNESSSGSFGRSYANAVKQPVTQQSSYSLDFDEQHRTSFGTSSGLQLSDIFNFPSATPASPAVPVVKPLMGMNVTLPPSFPPRLRAIKERRRSKK